jgi:4-hydroxythreonine-4-phosphate dehydrogenase
MQSRLPVLAVSCGEPAGIGPEISLRAAWALRMRARIVLIGNAAQLAALATRIDPSIQLVPRQPQADQAALEVFDHALAQPAVPGTLNPNNGRFALQCLDSAIDGAMRGEFDAIVTAPLQKSTINDAGVPFTGHTEYLAARTGAANVVMMLAAAGRRPLRVALATTHLALKEVPGAIRFESLLRTLEIIDHDLRSHFGIARPRILVAGLNPHAGESGYLGREEIEIIEPVLRACKAKGIDAEGPYPADTLFQSKYLDHADCVLAMYHDQGLPMLKHVSFGKGVNITLGLPIIRTSVDHGTALDLAALGPGRADPGSMIEAIEVALTMAGHAHSAAR